MFRFLIIILTFVMFFTGNHISAKAEELVDDYVILKNMLTEIEQAINKKDIDDVLAHLHPNVNIVFQNAEIVDGVEAVRAFDEKMLKGDSPILKGHSVKATVDKPAEIYGDTAVAYGTAVDRFQFAGGMDIEVTSKWTATLIKENDLWKVVSLQFSTNIFDNPLLNKANEMAKYFGIGGILLGLVLSWIFCRMRCRKKA